MRIYIMYKSNTILHKLLLGSHYFLFKTNSYKNSYKLNDIKI